MAMATETTVVAQGVGDDAPRRSRATMVLAMVALDMMMMVDTTIVVTGGMSAMAAMTLAIGRTLVAVMAVLLDADARRRWVARPVLLLHAL
jgi:hypothetical protein